MNRIAELNDKLRDATQTVENTFKSTKESLLKLRGSIESVEALDDAINTKLRSIEAMPTIIDAREAIIRFLAKTSQTSYNVNQFTECLYKDTEWLTSTTIDYYMSLIRTPKQRAFPAFLWEKIQSHKSYHESMKMLSETLHIMEVFALPININNKHWIALSADLERKLVIIADSMFVDANEYKYYVNEMVRLVLNTASLFHREVDFSSGWYILLNSVLVTAEDYLEPQYLVSSLNWTAEYDIPEEEDIECESLSSSGGMGSVISTPKYFIESLCGYAKVMPIEACGVMKNLDTLAYIEVTKSLLYSQDNTYDCGIYACAFITSIVKDWPQYCSPKVCKMLRKAMAVQISRRSFI